MYRFGLETILYKCTGLILRRLCINVEISFKYLIELETVMYKCTGLVWRRLCMNI